MKRLMTLTATGAFLGASLLGATGASAASIGGPCTAAQWGTSTVGLTCGQTSKTKWVWVRLPSAASAPPAAVGAGAKPTATLIPAGQWLVGSEVTPGDYRTTEPSCYYERLSGFTGAISDIIANGHTLANGGIVSILGTDKAFTSKCAWAKIG